jgi:hypothetical protein
MHLYLYLYNDDDDNNNNNKYLLNNKIIKDGRILRSDLTYLTRGHCLSEI